MSHNNTLYYEQNEYDTIAANSVDVLKVSDNVQDIRSTTESNDAVRQGTYLYFYDTSVRYQNNNHTEARNAVPACAHVFQNLLEASRDMG